MPPVPSSGPVLVGSSSGGSPSPTEAEVTANDRVGSFEFVADVRDPDGQGDIADVFLTNASGTITYGAMTQRNRHLGCWRCRFGRQQPGTSSTCRPAAATSRLGRTPWTAAATVGLPRRRCLCVAPTLRAPCARGGVWTCEPTTTTAGRATARFRRAAGCNASRGRWGLRELPAQPVRRGHLCESQDDAEHCGNCSRSCPAQAGAAGPQRDVPRRRLRLGHACHRCQHLPCHLRAGGLVLHGWNRWGTRAVAR